VLFFSYHSFTFGLVRLIHHPEKISLPLPRVVFSPVNFSSHRFWIAFSARETAVPYWIHEASTTAAFHAECTLDFSGYSSLGQQGYLTPISPS